jgi:cell division protein ZapA
MADVRLIIANREYIVTCADGEEERLHSLGAVVNEMALEAGGSAGGLNESRTLLYSALLLADKLYEARNNGAIPANAVQKSPNADAIALERLADRIEKVVEQLEL